MKTPLTLITGALGSGKTTLLRHVIASVPKKMALLVNEFGEIAIDSRVIEGKNVRMAELAGGCVCCSLIGEFEAAVAEIIEKVAPELLIVEATGVAEPDALIFDIQDNLAGVRLDGVVTVVDAEGLLHYPELGHTTKMQIEAADLIVLNKRDLVREPELARLKEKLARLKPGVPILETERCQVDPDLLFGIGREREIRRPDHVHQPEFESFSYASESPLDRGRFEAFLSGLGNDIYRAKGFVRFAEGTHLFNFVGGRVDFEAFEAEKTILVFIGRRAAMSRERILKELKRCEAAR